MYSGTQRIGLIVLLVSDSNLDSEQLLGLQLKRIQEEFLKEFMKISELTSMLQSELCQSFLITLLHNCLLFSHLP